MNALTPRYAAVLGTGSYVPDRVVTNRELEQALGEPVDEWLRAKVGILERRVMADDQVTSICASPRRAARSSGPGRRPTSSSS